MQESKTMIDDLLQTVNGLLDMANGEQLVSQDETPAEEPQEEKTTPETELAELEAMGLYDAQLQEVELGLKQNLPVQLYAQNCYNWMQMKEIRLGMQAQVDVKWYTNPLYNAEQMHQIRLGLEYGLDVSVYARLIYTVSDMYKKRHALMEEKYRSGGEKGQERYVLDEFTGIQLHFSADLMSAWIMLPADGKREYTIAELRRLLKKYDVRHGIQADGLHQATIQSTRGKEILIAQGTPAMPGKDGYYELFFDRELPDGPEVLADGSVDYSHVIVADTAEPGQKLAEYRPASRGKAGMTVTCLAIDGPAGRELPPLTGSGIVADHERRIYTAAIKGYVTFDAYSCKLSVMQMYQVKGDVNGYTSIIYDGSIYISGSVSGKALIRATGDVIVDGFVEGGTIEAGHNVILRSGVNAADQGSIQAGDQIMGKFFEHVRLMAGGNIEGNYFLDCIIYSEGRVVAKGGKSRIMGGETTASLGVEARIIGNYGSVRTVVTVANLYELTEQLESLKEQQKKVVSEQEKLKEGRGKLQKLMEDGAVYDHRVYQRILQAIEIRQNEWDMLELRKEHLKIVKRDAMLASVNALRELRPGTVVVINGVTKVIVDTMPGITLTEAILLEKND